MLVYLCDNSIEGFLTAVFFAYKKKQVPQIFSDPSQIMLDAQTEEIICDRTKAQRVTEGILRIGGHSLWTDILYAYAAAEPNRENIIYAYLRLIFEKGQAAQNMLAHKSVAEFYYLKRKPAHELARMTGFLRFMEMQNGVFYAPMICDNDILELLMPHFLQRFNTQKFIIHDIKRKKIAIYDGKYFIIAPIEANAEIMISAAEEEFCKIWQKYYQAVAIEQRKNTRAQNSFLPKKYRSLLPEFNLD